LIATDLALIPLRDRLLTPGLWHSGILAIVGKPVSTARVIEVVLSERFIIVEIEVKSECSIPCL
jgi:hypothetical protein